MAIGKIADTFDSYPYTIKLTGINNYGEKKNYSGTATFNSETNLDFYFEYIPKGSDKVTKYTRTFYRENSNEYSREHAFGNWTNYLPK